MRHSASMSFNGGKTRYKDISQGNIRDDEDLRIEVNQTKSGSAAKIVALTVIRNYIYQPITHLMIQVLHISRWTWNVKGATT